MDWNAVVGRNVRRRRQELGLSQEQVAHDAGITLRYMGMVERGQQNPSLDVMVRIAAALSMKPADLLAD